jgi:hypothetical protein
MAILVVSIHYYPHRKGHYQAMSVWREAERWYNFRAYQAAVKSSATREIIREMKKILDTDE